MKRAFEVAAIAAVLACVARTASPRSSADVQAVPANTTQALERAIEHGLTVFTHGGAVSGFIARNTFIPQTRSAVVVVISDDGGPLANAIVERALSVAMPARAANLPVTTGPSAAREDRGEIPRVSGPEPGTTASALFKALQAGTLDRSGLSEEYNVFVTDAKAGDASRALKPLGAPTGVSVRSVGERGGMEVSSVRLTFGSGALDALMYRSPDGRSRSTCCSGPEGKTPPERFSTLP